MAIAHTASPHFASRRHDEVRRPMLVVTTAGLPGRRRATYPQILLASVWISCASLR
ncbi:MULTISPECIES: hypothetical protein [unclassified Burkholderia]|uniref:hypothetical protein n=1 Tax=unclassified Burkholderia TaxID=2613784 RepID=UPI00158CA339|nr:MULTISPECIES: hypothetical protein [unclassified Burkholderia]